MKERKEENKEGNLERLVRRYQNYERLENLQDVDLTRRKRETLQEMFDELEDKIDSRMSDQRFSACPDEKTDNK